MPSAFVLINTEIGFEDSVLTEIKKLENIQEAYVTYGVFDIVAKVGGESMDNLKDIISQNIRRLEKVRSTLTMIVVEGK